MASAALSQPYPTRPIRLVVPFAAGVFAYYLSIGLLPDSPTQNPEKLYKQRGFFAHTQLCAFHTCVHREPSIRLQHSFAPDHIRAGEKFALSQGLATITVETLYDAKAHFSR